MKAEKIKDFFTVPFSQRRGYFLFGIILILIIIAPALYKTFIYQPQVINLEKDRKEIEAFLSSIRYKTETQQNPYRQKPKYVNLDHPEFSAASSKLTPFKFNPNNLPADKWLEMGFSKKQVQSIKKFEQKGGRFYTKQDVKKLWVISAEEYSIIEPYIQLPDSLSDRRNYERENETKAIQIVELNSADTTLLKTLPGIGSAFARRIFNYKSKLGGFHSKQQLLEVKGMDSARYAGIEKYVDINPWLIRKININTTDFNSLSSHPYISNNVAISLINYRNRHGQYSAIEEVMESELIDSELFRRLAPYLSTE